MPVWPEGRDEASVRCRTAGFGFEALAEAAMAAWRPGFRAFRLSLSSNGLRVIGDRVVEAVVFISVLRLSVGAF